jgi:hypothetical protein
MNRKKPAPTTTQMDGKTEEGVVYLSSIPYGDRRTTKVTADKLVKYAKNVYGAGVTHKQRNLIFQEKYKIRVLDPNQESDTDLENRLTLMCDQKDVRMWPALQLAWYDAFWFGMSFFNPVWGYEGNEYVLQKLRHLPPESFGMQPYGRAVLYSEILKGVVINPTDQTVEYWQTLNPMDISQMPSEISPKMLQKKLENIFTVKDPVSSELAGSPTIIPIIPLLTMLDFSWQSQVQKVNRIGAPLMFLKIINPQGDDIRYGQAFLNNWGKSTGMQLRPNMEIVVPDLKDNSSALQTIEALNMMIIDYFSPTSMLNSSSGANPLSGSSAAEQELLYSYIRGIHSWISEAFEQLLQVYLDANAYEGYRVHIDIPSPSIDKSDLWLKQADLGAKYGFMTTNELRDFMELPELDDAGLEGLRADVGVRQPAPIAGSPAMAQAELAIKAMQVDKLDPYGITGQKGKKLIQTVLGIENGETE